ncbi:MAG: PUR family DNA/RNA-binding protein [Bacteroidetes bacterium]|nr:PUR family DNA/RNA-binding protein [Bacteroidota bacterium]
MGDFDNNDQKGDIFSIPVRAGKRTYFFDVRSTRSNDYYLTITESKKKFTEGSDKPFFEKHKLFLYREDFEKFLEGLHGAVDHIKANQPEWTERVFHNNTNNPGNPADGNHSTDGNTPEGSGYSDVNFDDLGKP